MNWVELTFAPNDTLFFRESRPMEAHASKPLGGVFPPAASTVAGAVRSLIGEALNVNWKAYRQTEDRTDFTAVDVLIGRPTDASPGPLHLIGPYPVKNSQRLFPVPLHLFFAKQNNRFTFLKPGKAMQSDLGLTSLAILSDVLPGAKPLENSWVGLQDLQTILAGKSPSKIYHTESDLLVSEPRLGIALSRSTRAAVESQLYQTVHARLNDKPEDKVEVGVMVKHRSKNIADHIAKNQVVRLGGEGRFAFANKNEGAIKRVGDILPMEGRSPAGITLALLSPALIETKAGDPDIISALFGFDKVKQTNGVLAWQGKLGSVDLTITTAVLGKAIRQGGWDLYQHASIPARSLAPAGSVFFCECENPVEAVKKINSSDCFIGGDNALGFGELVAGYWY